MKQLVLVSVGLLLASCGQKEGKPPVNPTNPKTAEEYLKSIESVPSHAVKPAPFAQPETNEYAIQRFVPLPEVAGSPIIKGVPRPYLALDTMSGNLCKTWGWDIESELKNLFTCQELFEALPPPKKDETPHKQAPI